MKIEKLEGFQDYTISYSAYKKQHYCKAELSYKGYKIELPSKYYPTLDEAVQGLKDRIIGAIKEFDLKIKEDDNT